MTSLRLPSAAIRAAHYRRAVRRAPRLRRSVAKMLPEFQETTGITVNVETMPYENSREKQVLHFTGGTGLYDVVLIDVVWVGEFAASQWVTPMSMFIDNPALSDPALNLEWFFPILLESFGTWDDVLYGLPFDNYSGVMYYNTAMLADAGFEAPLDTWQDLKDVYGPALTSGDQYAYALQSRRRRKHSRPTHSCAWSGPSAAAC